MGEWRIICIRTEGPHKHISAVGIGTSPTVPQMEYDIDKVFQMMSSGDNFITRSTITKLADNVRKQACGTDGCTVQTIRNGPKAHDDQKVETLAACPEAMW